MLSLLWPEAHAFSPQIFQELLDQVIAPVQHRIGGKRQDQLGSEPVETPKSPIHSVRQENQPCSPVS